jgi:hypothetical protein
MERALEKANVKVKLMSEEEEMRREEEEMKRKERKEPVL